MLQFARRWLTSGALLVCLAGHAWSAEVTDGGKFGGALRAGETYAAAPALSAMYFTVPRTVECWVKIGSKDQDTAILGYEPRSSIEHWSLFAAKNTGALTAYLTGYNPKTFASKTNIADGKWHYIAMTFDGSMVRLFVDGQSAAEIKAGKIPGYSDMGSLTFGHVQGMESPKDLLIDEVRLSRGLRKIGRVPDAPFTSDADTVGLWHFDEKPKAGEEYASFADASVNHNRARLAEGDEVFTSTSPQSTRWQLEDHGPFFSSSLTSTEPTRNDTNKGVSIRLGQDGKAGICFDTELLRVSAAWTGGFMKIYPGRDGLAQHPDPDGKVEFGCGATPGWARGEEFSDPRPDHVGPLPIERGHYKGLYLNHNQVVLSYSVFGTDVLEGYDLESHDNQHVFARTLAVGPCKDALTTLLCELHDGHGRLENPNLAVLEKGDQVLAVALVGDAQGAKLQADEKGRVELVMPAHDNAISTKALIWRGTKAALAAFSDMAKNASPAVDLSALTNGGPPRGGAPLVTQGQLGREPGAYVVDTLTAPDDNPFKSYLRFSGVDFFKNGDAAICSISGDVWVVSGIDNTLGQLKWKRYATGLFQPLGLRIVDDVVYVLGRDQITRLHDLNGDGEADFYENFNNGCKVTPGGHEYCTSLETDAEGNFYYTKCGNPTDHGGTMLRVSKDGSHIEVFATGLRNPNGMGASPTGLVTTSDNEGEWVPASRIDLVHKGQFLGFTPMAHGPTPDRPGYPIWIPHGIDNSSGGQTWVTGNRWGLAEGSMIHTSYGASALFLVMPEVVNSRFQGATYRFPLKFASGIMRARFSPKDGQLYVCGLKGWQTNGVRDGVFQRVRYTGKPVALPIEFHAYRDGVRIGFSAPLDPKTAEDAESWGVSQWNYRWSAAYGSSDWSVADPQVQGHDPVAVKSARLSKDHKTVFLEIPTIKPVMQMEVQYNLDTEKGSPLEQEIYASIHELRPAASADDLEKPVPDEVK